MTTNKFFIFRFWADDKEFLLDFVYHDGWKRSIVLNQLVLLFPDAKSFKLFDGITEFSWDNTPEDLQDIINKIEYVEAKTDIYDKEIDNSNE